MEKTKEDLQKSEEELKEAAEVLKTEQAEEAKAEEKLEEKTAERLKKVLEKGGSLDEEPEPSLKEELSTPEPETLAEEPAEEPNKDDSTAAEKDETTEEKGDDEEADDKKTDDDKGEAKKVPPLSDAYYRAAIHLGWKPEDIEAEYKANPELTVRTLGNAYESVNRLSKEYAALGRIQKEQVAAPVVEPVEKESEFKGIDVDALRKQYPDEPLIDLVATVNAQNKAMFDEIKATRSAPVATGQPSGITEAQTRALNQEVAMIQQQIDTFFKSDALKGYEDFYGTLSDNADDWSGLTPGQKQNRLVAIEMMDEMMTGAKHLGREMKIEEALERAHLSVTEPIREKVIREDIIAKVTKRSGNLSLKPSGTAQSTDTKPQTAAEFERVTAERLSKVYK